MTRALAAVCLAIATLAACSADRAPPPTSSSAGTSAPSDAPSATSGAPAPASEPAGTGAAGAAESTPPPPAAGSGGGSAAPIARDPRLAAILGNDCASATVRSDILPPNIMFVIDRSGSMNCNPPPTTPSAACEAQPTRANTQQASKWEITRDALTAAIGKLPKTSRVALSYFSNDDSCGVHSMPAVPLHELDDTQRAALEASLMRVQPAGGTPLVGATILAYRYLHSLALANTLLGNDFVVLLTDGAQSEQCGDPARCSTAEECTRLLTEMQVARAASAGSDIRTFVIGAPGSEPARRSLSTIAREGGTARTDCDPERGDCHFDMTREPDFSASLTQALAAIAGQAVSCELPLPAEARRDDFDPKLVNVIYSSGDSSTARVVPEDTRSACDGAQGWQYNPEMTRIRLCGSICDEVRTNAKARLDVILGCPVVAPQ